MMDERNDPDHPGRRWPQRVYGVGSEPDPRFTLANERTFLAWIRTSLALLAGGIALEALAEQVGGGVARTALALLLLAAGTVGSVLAFGRWMATERALRTQRPLPPLRMAPVLGLGIAAAGALACTILAVH